jgi:excisionase family DNA binding protein
VKKRSSALPLTRIGTRWCGSTLCVTLELDFSGPECPESMMSYRAAAEFLGVSENWIRKLARQGRIRSGRTGRRLRNRHWEMGLVCGDVFAFWRKAVAHGKTGFVA